MYVIVPSAQSPHLPVTNSFVLPSIDDTCVDDTNLSLRDRCIVMQNKRLASSYKRSVFALKVRISQQTKGTLIGCAIGYRAPHAISTLPGV